MRTLRWRCTKTTATAPTFWRLTARWKSTATVRKFMAEKHVKFDTRRNLITTNEVKRNCMRATVPTGAISQQSAP